jgi:hypothetical protein
VLSGFANGNKDSFKGGIKVFFAFSIQNKPFIVFEKK